MGLVLTLLANIALAKTSLIVSEVVEDQVITSEILTIQPDTGIVEKAFAKGNYQFYIKTDGSCEYDKGAMEGDQVRFNKALPLTACADAPFNLKVRVAGDLRFTLDENVNSITLKLLPKKTVSKPFTRALPDIACSAWASNSPVTVDVSNTFKNGEVIRDFYSGNLATVQNNQVTMIPKTGSNGLLLLERADHTPSEFSWDNLTVYFIMTDRFHNGDKSNDQPFGRQKDGKDEIGTFHGGDIKGITQKLDYIKALGANAIWMTPLIEQVHGFVGGGKNGDFPFYAYHGYWALDYTKLDPNFGTDDDLRELVKEAHARGIRLIWDTVINHVGYATGQDLVDYNIEVFKSQTAVDNTWKPKTGQNWHSYHELIDYESTNWNSQWWNAEWVRGSFPGYENAGGDDLTMALAGLPDFRTDSSSEVNLPPILRNKPDTNARSSRQSVAEHIIDWQTYWVEEFGIDGFRSDTAKHVELEHWLSLKEAATSALAGWKSRNQDSVLDDSPFWMVGEVFSHPLYKDYYYDYGFDSLINFEFQDKAHELAMCMSNMESTFASYAKDINSDSSFNGLTYLSSHDTTLFYAKYQSLDLQYRSAAPFLLLPGGVQIYYGDESGRNLGPYGDDFHQGTRSDMNWEELTGERAQLLKHWQTIGQFRSRHNSIGAGTHTLINQSPYTFSRTLNDDAVVVVFAGNEG
jgi:alpha-amylase